MVKKIVFVHGWKSHPEDAWFKWLGQNLRDKGYDVVDPKMSYRDKDIYLWIDSLEEFVGELDSDTIFVAHSLGGFVTLKFLEKKLGNRKIKGIILVAPWADVKEVINFDLIKSSLNKSVIVFSDNDSHISKEIEKFYGENLGAEVIIQKGMGHFSTKDSVFELPIVLQKIEELYKS